MKIEVSNTLTVIDPTPEMVKWCKKHLSIVNPEYIKKSRMHLWLGNTPSMLSLYEQRGNDLILPFGTLRNLPDSITKECYFTSCFADPVKVNFKGSIPLYDYQEEAVQVAYDSQYGIIQSPAGSGKTQMGIALAQKYGRRALWLTHTLDLLRQSQDRAERYLDKSLLGTITGGKVNIGAGITFATIQTMCKLDLGQYKDFWDVIIVDECFPAGTMIMTPHGEVPIQFMSPGELVVTRNEITGKVEMCEVEELQCRPLKGSLIRITTQDGRSVTCTSNHPFYTRSGYRKASELQNGDELYCLRERVRFVDMEPFPTIRYSQRRALSLLLKRMFGKGKVSSFILDRRAERDFQKNNARNQSQICFGADEKAQSDGECRSQRQGIEIVTTDRTPPFDAGRKRAGHDKTTSPFDETVVSIFPASRICCSYEVAKAGLSNSLQNRHCFSKRENSGRDRRWFSWLSKGTERRLAKNGIFNWIRVASVEVLQPGDYAEHRKLCEESYVYNLAVKHNHNYFANGFSVHNCHRCAGTPTAMTQFSKVLNALAARHKYGLSATVHRSDGMIEATYALLGPIVHDIPKEAVEDKIMRVGIKPEGTGLTISREALNTDGTLNYSKLITYLTESVERNALIVSAIEDNEGRPSLILSDRLDHLFHLKSLLPSDMEEQAVMISGKMTTKKGRAEREQAMEDMRTGRKKYLFATYSLAKEGLDIPCLERLYLTTPQKDYAIVTQSIGRIARICEGKADPIAYDFVDNIVYLIKSYKNRCTIYRKNGCYFV